MAKTLLVFVDSLSATALHRLPFLSQWSAWRVISGLGFSTNIKAEFFAGLRPDDIGYFNEWTYAADSRFRRHRAWLPWLRPLSLNYRLDRLAHRVVGRLLTRKGILNIPFPYLPYFDRRGGTAYDDSFSYPSLFSETANLVRVRYSDFPAGPERDRMVFEAARQRLRQGNFDTLFVASADLDHVTHLYGTQAKPYWAKLAQLDHEIGACASTFWEHHPDGNFVLVSDHGMADVTRGIDTRPELELGPAREDTYLYFVDATMVRFWVFDSSLRERVAKYLAGIGPGHVLSEAERQAYAVTRPEFGDFIYLLHEGAVFSRTFWGRGLPRAMHGYQPLAESQKGLVLSNRPLYAMGQELAALDVYHGLKALLWNH
jgi:hypothetical protein